MGVFGSRLGWGDSIFGNIMGPRRRFPFCDPCALHGWGARRGEHRDEARDPDAISLLQLLIDKPPVSVPKARAQFALADIYLSEHQPDKAKVIYDQVSKDNPLNAIGQMAKAHQDEMK